MHNTFIDSDRRFYYRTSIGWFTVKELAIAHGWIDNGIVLDSQDQKAIAAQQTQLTLF